MSKIVHKRHETVRYRQQKLLRDLKKAKIDLAGIRDDLRRIQDEAQDLEWRTDTADEDIQRVIDSLSEVV